MNQTEQCLLVVGVIFVLLLLYKSGVLNSAMVSGAGGLYENYAVCDKRVPCVTMPHWKND